MQGIIVLNKPKEFTSMDCCAIIRKLSGERKVGHTGTLDPNATGVLPICIGKATRLIEYMDSGSKTYIAGFKLGFSSDTEDIWGELKEDGLDKVKGISKDDVESELKSFEGDIEQIPPMYSAKRVNGQRLYDIARSGKEIDRKPNMIHIYHAKLLSYENGEGEIEITCSRGTYIRTICAELGRKLGLGAVMSSLIRTKAAGYDISEAIKLEDLRDNPELITVNLKNIESAVSEINRRDINEQEMKLFINGNPVFKIPSDELTAIFYNNKLLGLTENKKIRKVFNENI